ncbi:hypothetical protein GCM10023168_13350 [Fodinibacter luteus]|uniref:Uncharacterized protein n=1 Tax=Fodinibacter luteus TaxID=552064 RepID=A0ABP8K9K0_9MICO
MSTSTSAGPAPAPARTDSGVRGWLGWFALAVVVGMQAGTVFRPLGSAGETRVADWVDLLTPYAVLGTAAVVLVRAGATRSQWVLFGVGGVSFALGKGLHISANSASNVADTVVADSSIVHLWDEVVSHLVWYTGLFVVLLAVAWALRDVEFRVGPLDLLVGGLVALTLVNTYIEGAQPVLGLLFLATLVVTGLRWRPAPVSRLLLVVGGLGLLLLLGWGVAWLAVDGSFFPEFSELGWI